jgi:hypothetical protein
VKRYETKVEFKRKESANGKLFFLPLYEEKSAGV